MGRNGDGRCTGCDYDEHSTEDISRGGDATQHMGTYVCTYLVLRGWYVQSSADTKSTPPKLEVGCVSRNQSQIGRCWRERACGLCWIGAEPGLHMCYCLLASLYHYLTPDTLYKHEDDVNRGWASEALESGIEAVRDLLSARNMVGWLERTVRSMEHGARSTESCICHLHASSCQVAKYALLRTPYFMLKVQIPCVSENRLPRVQRAQGIEFAVVLLK